MSRSPSRDESDAVARAEETLREARSTASQTRWLVSGALTAVGTAITLAGIIGYVVTYTHRSTTFIHPNVFVAIIPPGLVTLLCALLPTDHLAVRNLCTFLVAVSLSVAAICFWLTAKQASSPPPRSTSTNLLTAYFALAAVTSVSALAEFSLAFRAMRAGLETRATLVRLWLILRITLTVFGAFLLIFNVALVATSSQLAQEAWNQTPSSLSALSSMLCGLCARASLRRRVFGYLQRLTTIEEVQSASTVASLLGGVGAKEAMKLAMRQFRSIDACHVTASGLAAAFNGLVNTELLAVTRHTTLGSVDAFLSQ
jgi:hypothetical protein